MDDIQVCSNWEDIAENSAILEKQLEKLRLEKTQQAGASSSSSSGEPKIRILTRNKADNNNELKSTESRNAAAISSVVLDSTRAESLRSQYVPPEPKIKLLTRPKNNTQGVSNGLSAKSKSQQPVKTLEQREKEYMEARMRILGDVQFSDPEDEPAFDGPSPAEVLKNKISQALTPREGDEKDALVFEEDKKTAEVSESAESGEGTGATQKKSKVRGKKNRERFKTPNLETPRDFPISKVESDRIVRQPRGPDGTAGFHR